MPLPTIARSSFTLPGLTPLSAQGFTFIPGLGQVGVPAPGIGSGADSFTPDGASFGGKFGSGNFDPSQDVPDGTSFGGKFGSSSGPSLAERAALEAQTNAFTPDTEKDGAAGFFARLGASGPINRRGLIGALSDAFQGRDEFREARLRRDEEEGLKKQALEAQIQARQKSAAKTSLVNLINPQTKDRLSLLEGDPRIGALIQAGFVEATKASDEKGPDNRQQAIDNIVRTEGLDPQQAALVVDGVIETNTDPVTGQVTFVNTATREVSPSNRSDSGQSSAQNQQDRPPTPDAAFDALVAGLPETGRVPQGVDVVDKATGPIDNAVRALGRVPGIGFFVDAAEETEASNVARAFENEVRGLFREGRGRLLAQELPKIEGQLLPALGTFSTEEEALAAMQSTRRQLRAIGEREIEAARDPNNGPKIRREANAFASNIGRVVKFVDEIIASSERAEPVVRSQQDFDSLPSGAIYVDRQGRRRRKP